MANEKIKQNYKNIANAIRAKTGENGVMTAEEMPDKISAIETGITPTGTKSITANGNGIDVTEFAAVDVNVPGSTPTGTMYITENGTYDVSNYAEAEVETQQIYDSFNGWFLSTIMNDSSNKGGPFVDTNSITTEIYDGNIYVGCDYEWTASGVHEPSYHLVPGMHEMVNELRIALGVVGYAESSSKEWVLTINIEYSSYDGDKTAEELTSDWEDYFSSLTIAVYDMRGIRIGHVSYVAPNITIREGC